MTTQKKKPRPGQHRKVEPLTEKVEPVTPLHPQFEVLQERMNHLATREQMAATTMQMNKLHGEAMARMDVMQAHMDHMATREEMHKLHGETMGSIEATRAEMHKLHGEAMGRIGRVEGDLTVIKWTLAVFVAPLIIAMAAGILKLVFFP